MTGQTEMQRRLTSLAMWLAHLHVATQEQREAVDNYARHDLFDGIVAGLNGDPSASGPRYHVPPADREACSFAEGCLLALFATLQSVLQTKDSPILIASSGQGRLTESLATSFEDRTLDLGQKLRPR